MNYINYYNNLYGCHYICSYYDNPVSYNCTDNTLCEAVYDNSGLYRTIDECIKNCTCRDTFDCIDGNCVKAPNCKGEYSSINECLNNCTCKGCGWLSIYDTHLSKAYSKGNYCDNNCGYGFTQYYSYKGSFDSNEGSPWPTNCINDCLSITKSDIYDSKYYTFIQYYSQKAFPSEAECSTHCKAGTTVTGSPIGADKKWYIQFPEKGNYAFEIYNHEQNTTTNLNCFYQLKICRNCDDCTVVNLSSSTEGSNIPVYKGVADVPHKIFIEYKGTI